MKKSHSFIIAFFIIANACFAQSGWFWQNPFPQGNHLSSVKFISSTIGWAVGDFGTILRTPNGGTNWTTQSSGTTNSLYAVSFTDANNGTAVGMAGTILRTTNGGANWTSQSSGTINSLNSVSFTNVDTGTVVGSSGTIIRTTNGGTNWTLQSSGTTNYLYGVSFTDDNNGTAVGDSGTILRTTNGGTTWTLQSSGTTNHLYGVSFTDANNGTVVGANGTILRTINGGVSVNQISSEIPESFVLFQNYPNPFNPVTKIKFDITRDVRDQTQDVKLIIFDVLGKKVATLVNNRLSAGSYEVEFNGSNFSSGIYFYRLETESFVLTKSLVLLK